MFGKHAVDRGDSGHKGCSTSTRNFLASTRDRLDCAEPHCGHLKGSFNLVKWETSGGCCKRSETSALLSSPHLYEAGHVITAFLLQ